MTKKVTDLAREAAVSAQKTIVAVAKDMLVESKSAPGNALAVRGGKVVKSKVQAKRTAASRLERILKSFLL